MDALNLEMSQKKTVGNTSVFMDDPKSRHIYGKGTSKHDWMSWEGLTKLPIMNIEQIFLKHARVVILSPHPDDEILGCAGLIQQLYRLNREILVVGVTKGTASHPHSSQYSSDELARLRPLESRQALDVLVGKNQIQYLSLGLVDGKITQQQALLEQHLSTIIQENDILISTYEKDGHPDHESLGQFVTEFSQSKGLTHLQAMIWAWHWAKPNDIQIEWTSILRLELNEAQIEKKAKAIQCFKTQIEDDNTMHQSAIIPPHVIDRILMPWEFYFDAT